MGRLKLILICVCFFGQIHASESKSSSPDFFIIDSWLCGYVGGFVHGKGARFSWAWKEAVKRSKHDAKIWGGLFISDTNQTGLRRFGEVTSRFVYQTPQTLGGFLVGQAYSTFTGKVNDVRYANGTVVMNMNVDWPGVCLGTYILAKKSIAPYPNNKMFQHEYGHYLQSKRMGWAYFVRVGLPAIMSKGDHDAHPVEIDCNREAFIYFNRYYPTFQNDSLISDNKGWNFRFNPFPDSIGECRYVRTDSLTYIDANQMDETLVLEPLKVKARFFDYASWIIIPAPVIVGVINAKRYNKALGVVEKK
ncbi:MAG: hypothetical protein ACOVO3_07515 [Fluviicola sp.]